jgi:thiamine biosynthesis lipoprotein ApbE
MLFLIVSLTGCAGRKTFSKEQYYLGSKFQITYQYKGNKTGKRQSAIVSRRVFDFLQLLDSKLNIVNPISEVSAVNGNGSFSAVPVSREIFEIFIKAKKAEELTENAFGITFVQLVDVINQGNYSQASVLYAQERKKNPDRVTAWLYELSALKLSGNREKFLDLRKDFLAKFPNLAQLELVKTPPRGLASKRR